MTAVRCGDVWKAMDMCLIVVMMAGVAAGLVVSASAHGDDSSGYCYSVCVVCLLAW